MASAISDFQNHRSVTHEDTGYYSHGGVHIRRLNQPFTWNFDNETGSGATGQHDGVDDAAMNKTETKTCRNSVQGKALIADDRGYVCDRRSLKNSGCCDSDTSQRYSCSDCHSTTGCCKVYETCISCCMDPKHVSHL